LANVDKTGRNMVEDLDVHMKLNDKWGDNKKIMQNSLRQE